MVAVNPQGTLYVTHAALPHLLAAVRQEPRRVADVVTLGSTAGRKAFGVYGATKGAVDAFSEALRREVAPRGVRVDVIEAGSVDTQLMTANWQRLASAGMQPPGASDPEWLRPDDVAAAIAYAVTCPRRAAVNEIRIQPADES